MATADVPAASSTSRLRYLPLAVLASLVHMAMMIPGYTEDGDFKFGEWLTVLVVSLVVGGLVFVLVVPGAGAVSGLVLGVVALVSVGVFWAGLTLPLAAAAGVVGLRARQGKERTGLGVAAIVLAAVAAVALVAVIIGDAASS